MILHAVDDGVGRFTSKGCAALEEVSDIIELYQFVKDIGRNALEAGAVLERAIEAGHGFGVDHKVCGDGFQCGAVQEQVGNGAVALSSAVDGFAADSFQAGATCKGHGITLDLATLEESGRNSLQGRAVLEHIAQVKIVL